MRNTFKVMTLITGALALHGCGSGDRSYRLAEVGTLEPVIVTLGGFSSCVWDGDGWTPEYTDRWIRAEALSAATASTLSSEIHWLRGCADTSGNYYFTSSFIYPRVTAIRMTDIHVLRNNLYDASGQFSRPIFIMGHSHGAWLAMKLAAALPEADIRTLMTVDPISYLHCRPAHYLAAVGNPLNSANHLAGCQQAPVDVDYAAIIRNVGGFPWHQYYQRNFLPLRSSVVPGPHQPSSTLDMSPFLSVSRGGVAATWNAHTGIDGLGAIWHSAKVIISREARSPSAGSQAGSVQ